MLFFFSFFCNVTFSFFVKRIGIDGEIELLGISDTGVVLLGGWTSGKECLVLFLF